MQTNPAVEQSKIVRRPESPWNQSSRKGKGLNVIHCVILHSWLNQSIELTDCLFVSSPQAIRTMASMPAPQRKKTIGQGDGDGRLHKSQAVYTR